MINRIFNMVFIFLYYLICICVYILYENKKSKKIHVKSKLLKNETKQILIKEIYNFNNDKKINKENIEKIIINLKSKDYKKHIIKTLLEFKDREQMIRFVKQTKLLDLVLAEKVKDEFDKAYKIYIIGEFKFESHYDYLIENCQDKSIYIQMNILKALAKLGDEEYFIDGLKKIMKSSSLIHEKVLIDSIYSFYEKNQSLNKILEKELIYDDNELNKIILSHFTNVRYTEAVNNVYDLLENKYTDKEVKIACMRYFSGIECYKVKKILIDLLNDENWEVRAISANTLKNYNYEDVVTALKKSIKDKVWYVRQNSARSLYSLVNNNKHIMEIISGDDKYASDAMLSILSEEEKQDWIIDLELEHIAEKFEYENMVVNI